MDEGQVQAAGESGRAGMVAIVGRASVGKSSLLNALLGEKVSIVSPVAQTTRNLVRGILTEPRGQLAFLDTPGVHRTATDLGRVMNRTARAAVEGVDAVLLVLDGARVPREEDEGWMRRLLRRDEGTALHFALNKADTGLPAAPAYRALWAALGEGAAAAGEGPAPEPAWHTVSAQTGEGVSELLDALFASMPVHPMLFPADVLTDFPRRLAIADTIREKLIVRLRDELPHRVAVWVESLEEREEGWDVSAVIYVDRGSQKGIVIGHKGRPLRAVRRASAAELSNLYARPVRVSLRVDVEPNWTRNHFFLRKLGYV